MGDIAWAFDVHMCVRCAAFRKTKRNASLNYIQVFICIFQLKISYIRDFFWPTLFPYLKGKVLLFSGKSSASSSSEFFADNLSQNFSANSNFFCSMFLEEIFNSLEVFYRFFIVE